jgi:DNA topoisomerase I
MGQSPPRPFRRTRADRRAAPDRRSRTRDQSLREKEYWTIDANLAAAKPPAFDARFLGKGEEKIEVTNGEDAEKIRLALEKADWVVRSAEKKERRRNATPPFTTSKLQQDSSRKLRFSVKRTMMIAQRLYEGVELGDEGLVGLITYMRTDSTRVAPEAITEVREYITSEYGARICPILPIHIRRRKKRRRRTRPFARLRRCAIPTRSNNICRKTNSRFTS